MAMTYVLFTVCTLKPPQKNSSKLAVNSLSSLLVSGFLKLLPSMLLFFSFFLGEYLIQSLSFNLSWERALLDVSDERSGGPRRDRIYRTIENNEGPLWDPATLPQLEVRLTRPNPAPYRPPRELRTSREESWLKTAPVIRRSEESIKSRLEPLRQEEGFRIVVSNLQPTVTHEDIKELFEDIGPLIGSRLVRPGTAEVVYRDLKDAVAAVDTYHNRQLDGQPMKCLLVKPSSSGTKGIVGTKGTVVPDLSTIHKALFMK